MAIQRPIVTGQFISLDGVVEAPETWHFPYVDDELVAAINDMHASADTLLLGRVTYDAFATSWPNQTGKLADHLNGMRKLAASNTLTAPKWTNSTIIGGDLVDAVTSLKQEPGRNILLSGSITLTRTLLHAGLIDELRLFVHPIVLGSGRRLFPDDATDVPLTLIRSATYPTGVIELTYRPATPTHQNGQTT
ncbi:dihydrofolate reductase family protein [Stackebrandtia soli]|uniref:dihydrofolate reductase family protein n=1 Tax=Stackebrandtia soli TaxID=1892856 RepID=UPI0039ED4062